MPPLSRQLVATLAILLTLAATALILYYAIRSDRAVDVSLLSQAIAVGVIAQLIDGALGMAYGVTATTFLLSSGVSPLVATASVHMAEMFTTAASGLSHWQRGNVDRRLFLSLLLPGILGALAGVALVVHIDTEILKPLMAAYLLLMGLYILYKARGFLRRAAQSLSPARTASLAVAGGFLDASGGGGWGPIVTSTLLGTGREPKTTIGSVNAAEFFVTLITGFSFALFVGITHWEAAAGLIIGGMIAAPVAALVVSRIPARLLMWIVGVVVCGLSAITLYQVV
jgi:uncharacterized membrane protein YfcA